MWLTYCGKVGEIVERTINGKYAAAKFIHNIWRASEVNISESHKGINLIVSIKFTDVCKIKVKLSNTVLFENDHESNNIK